jgi:uncharacterized OB-fold protein
MRIVRNEDFVWKWCEDCGDYLVSPAAHRCPHCGAKYAERAQQPPATSKERQEGA